MDYEKVKTYPLHFSENKLAAIAEKAKLQGKTLKQFIIDAIDSAMRDE